MREMFDRLGCREHFLDAKPTRTLPMPRECMDILYSISFFVNEGKKPLENYLGKANKYATV